MPGDSRSVSAIMLSYNCERYIRPAVQSLLDQDCEPMEVLISDDASTDGTFEALEEVLRHYFGPHSVSLRRQTDNSGSKSAHLNRVVGDAQGDVIVSFDGDDVYDPRRVRSISKIFESDKSVHAVYSGYRLIDEEGKIIGRGRVQRPKRGPAPAGWFARVDAFASGSTLAVSRATFSMFGPLPPRIAEDVVLPFRASLLGHVHFIDEPLVSARRRSDSLTSSYERFRSIAAYRRRIEDGVDAAAAKLTSRMDDIDTACRLMPGRAREFDRLREIVRTSWRSAEISRDLVAEHFGSRARALLTLMMRRSYLDELHQNLALVVAPEWYLNHKRRQLGIRTAVDQQSSASSRDA